MKAILRTMDALAMEDKAVEGEGKNGDFIGGRV